MQRRFIISVLLATCCFLFLLCETSFSVQALEEARATVRVGKHADFIRIVFTSDDEFVQKASVVLTSNNIIKVSFPSPGPISSAGKGLLKNDLSYDLGKDVKITVKGGNCMFFVENLDDINVTKLSSPARLIIDARTSKAAGSPSVEKSVINIKDMHIPYESFIIDPGHGGHDSGLRGKGFVEKDLTLSIARDIAVSLGKVGKKAFLTRKSDQDLSLKKRVKLINGKTPGMVISLHISAGSEFIVYSPPRRAAGAQNGDSGRKVAEDADSAIAAAVTKSLQDEFGMAAKHEELPLALIRSVNAPALLIELPSPERLKYDKKNREMFINALFKGMSRPAAPAAPASPAAIEKL